MMDNIWKNDKGFLWMLAISLVSLISTQISIGIIWENKFILRVGFFLFTLVAIKSSSLRNAGKLIGYSIASAMLLLAIFMIWNENQLLTIVYTGLATCNLIYIIMLVINQIFAGGEITVYKIGGSVAVYILLGQLWSLLYLTTYIIDPGAFTHGGVMIQMEGALKQLSYFSFVTLTTIGYGDIIAISSMARILSMMEGLLGQLFPAIFIAKLVSLQLQSDKK